MTPSARKVLLSSVCQPFGSKYGDGFGVSYEGSYQIMWAQGLFRTRGTTTQWGIDYIAANLETPVTTLHYPTMDQFVAELQQGYDYVGIAFVSSTLHKALPMVRAIRQHAPQSKIVLGGYGTSLGPMLEPFADHICRGEGVRFMRELLGEPVDAPLVQPEITQIQKLFSVPLNGRTGYLIAGLGCPNGCDFCATSHYFKKKHIALLPDGPSLVAAMRKLWERHPDISTFWINDEDFLLNPTRGRSFLEAVRRSDLPPLSLSVFSSIKALSQYTAAELVEMGVDWVWVGFEGQRAGYSKMQGRGYRELFDDLHQHGISVLTSMIIGFDYQTPEIIQEEFEELISLRPTMSQFLIYGAAQGTPLYDRLQAEGRLDEAFYADNRLQDGFALGFRHPQISASEMSAIQRRLYHEEFRRLGPSVFRVVDDYLVGHQTLRDHPVARVRGKAQRYARDARSALPVLRASRRYVSPAVSAWLADLRARLLAETGPLTPRERLVQGLAPALLWREGFKLQHQIGQQPEFTRRSYRLAPAEAPALKPAPAAVLSPALLFRRLARLAVG